MKSTSSQFASLPWWVRSTAIAGLSAAGMGFLLWLASAAPGAPLVAGAAPPDSYRVGELGVTGPFTTDPTASPTSGTSEPITTTTPVTPATSTDTPTEVPSATPSVTPEPTALPQPAFLPVAVRDQACAPIEHYSDIVFMLDVSRFMDQDINGRQSREWVKDWMRDTVERLDMSRNKIGMVHFHRDVGIVQHLTHDRAAMLRAIDHRPERESANTRMDVALRVSRDELLSEHATPGNAKVIFFLSLMQAKGIPWETVPGCYEEIGEECAVIAAANEVKGGPGAITIYALATSWYGNGVLKGVASDPDKVYLLPGPAEWAKIHGEVESVVPCSFWPQGR